MTDASRLPHTVDLIEQGMSRGLHIGAQLYVSLRNEPVAQVSLGLARGRADGHELDDDLAFMHQADHGGRGGATLGAG